MIYGSGDYSDLATLSPKIWPSQQKNLASQVDWKTA